MKKKKYSNVNLWEEDFKTDNLGHEKRKDSKTTYPYCNRALNDLKTLEKQVLALYVKCSKPLFKRKLGCKLIYIRKAIKIKEGE